MQGQHWLDGIYNFEVRKKVDEEEEEVRETH